MSTSVKKNESPIQLWVMLGPLFVVGTVLIMNVNVAAAQWALPFISLVGLLLCYVWRWQGCLLGCLLLSVASVLQLFQHPPVGVFWIVILTLSFAISLIITTLFLDESQVVLDALRGDSHQVKAARIQLEELSFVQTKLESERWILSSDLDGLKSKLKEKEENLVDREGRLRSQDKLIAIVRQELLTSHSRQEKLLQDLFDACQKVAVLEQQIACLKEENEQAQLAMQEAAQLVITNESNTFKAQEVQVLHDAIIREMKENVETLSQEKQSLEMTLSSLQGQFEELSSNDIGGTCGINAKTGFDQPKYFFSIENDLEGSLNIPLMRPICYRKAPSEICSLYLLPEFRKEGLGRLLSLSRFLFVAAHSKRFESVIYAEMRGFVDKNQNCPFWEGIGRHFLDLDYATLMHQRDLGDFDVAQVVPKHPIYISLLPKEVQEVMGKIHSNTWPAYHMLMEEGFYLTNDIDIIDAGPKIEAKTNEIRTIKDSCVDTVAEITRNPLESVRYIISNQHLDFRACYSTLQKGPKGIHLPTETAEALKVKVGDVVRYIVPSPEISTHSTHHKT